MRLLKRLNRQQAALLFGFSHNLIEKLENGRDRITTDKFKLFQEVYGYSDREVEDLRSGKIDAPIDANCIRKRVTTEKRLDKRFRHRRITRECKVLKELRLRINLDQYSASKKCKLGNISKACKVMGFSRDTFYRYQNAVEEGGVESLINKSRRKPNVKNRVDPTIEDAVIKLTIDEPA